jgi:hypothetical protein
MDKRATRSALLSLLRVSVKPNTLEPTSHDNYASSSANNNKPSQKGTSGNSAFCVSAVVQKNHRSDVRRMA